MKPKSKPALTSEWYILIVLTQLHKPVWVGALDEWQNLQLGVFEIKNFGPKYIFSAIISIFSQLGGERGTLLGVNDVTLGSFCSSAIKSERRSSLK